MINAEQIRAARAILKWPAKELAEKANVSIPTIQRIESGGDAMGTTLQAIEAAITGAGITLIHADEIGGTGVRLKK